MRIENQVLHSAGIAWVVLWLALIPTVHAQATGGRSNRHAQALEFRRLKLQDEKGEIPAEAWMKAAAQKNQMRVDPAVWAPSPGLPSGQGSPGGARQPKVAGIQPSGWTWLGPGNIGGRVRSILIHPTTPSTMWVGSVAGGVWKTLNGGASWFPLDDFMANLAISCMAMDPTNPDVIYAGTGEGLGAGDGIQGAGIFKTTDGGATWTRLSSTATNLFNFVNRLAISPSVPQIILAATSAGIFRSANGGTNWNRTFAGTIKDLAFDPSDTSKCIASGFGMVLFSTNGGMTWSNATGFSKELRIEIAYAPSLPSTVYASANTTNGGDLFRSLDGGKTFTRRSTGLNYLEDQGEYANCVWVDPTNPTNLIVGGLDLWRSTDGGASLARISDWHFSASAHADQHIIVNHPSFDGAGNRTLFFGNDGGVFRSTDLGGMFSFFNLNHNLGITEFYGAAGSGAGNYLIAGSQDNGTVSLKLGDGTDGWTERWDGDGGFCATDPWDPAFFYGEYVWLQLHRSTALDVMFISGGIADAGPPGTNANFIAPFILDPNKPTTMLAGGRSLWRSENVRDVFLSWSIIKPALSHNASINLVGISAIAVAPGDSDVIWVGHNNGFVFATTNGSSASPNWTRRDSNAPHLPSRYCTRITIDPLDKNVVYVTYGGFESNNVWRTMDGGLTWASVSSNLPDAPVNTLIIDPRITRLLYVGTEVGIFASADGGAHWSPSNDGPANVEVDELSWMGIRLLAATHGRGCFVITPSVWVDFSLSCFSCGDGSFADPYSTFQRAQGYVSEGGSIRIKAGSSGNCCNCNPTRDCFPITILSSMTIEAFGGAVTLGQ
jgi:photosystem II stability/assembly factor-like uncharacterized protein